METVEFIDPINHRKYLVRKEGDFQIIIGPPEGLVDSLNLPEPFATTLHNILYNRRIFNSSAIQKDPRSVTGALQEALMLDVQKLTEAYFNFEKEAVHE